MVQGTIFTTPSHVRLVIENYTFFKEEWILAAQHILLIGESFNWDQILYVNLQEKFDKYQKIMGKKNPPILHVGLCHGCFLCDFIIS